MHVYIVDEVDKVLHVGQVATEAHRPTVDDMEPERVSLRPFGSGVPPLLSGFTSLFLRSRVDSRES